MTSRDLAVRVRAPSRLHFGLLAFGESAQRQFGGVGVTIERPGTQVLVDFSEPGADAWRPSNRAEHRAQEFAERFRQGLPNEARESLAHLRVRVDPFAAEHVGLGSGTQLAMAVARAIAVWAGKSDMPAVELARRVGRGRRSAIGVHGFDRGGFIVEAGKRMPDRVSPLVARLDFPNEWHFVLIIPSSSKGLYGAAEREAFDGLAPIDTAVTADLCRLTLFGLLPAVAEHDFTTFSESLFEFGHKVGDCFAGCQGGPYASPLASQIIESLNREGIRGIAQSSWGPTLCAVTDSRFRAEWLAARLADTLGPGTAEIICTPANNLGARTEVLSDAE